jgi:hypothetical protein
MKLTKNDLEQIARGRYFKLHIERQLWFMVVTVVWALCWAIFSKEATDGGKYLIMIIAMIPVMVEMSFMFYLVVKESKYVSTFVAGNSQFIEKEL